MAITVYTYNDKVLKNVATDKWLKKYEAPIDPYNPLGLPPNTVRVRTSDGQAPYMDYDTTYGTATLVQGTSNVYDVYKSGTDFSYFLAYSNNVIEVLGANTTGITGVDHMFFECTALTTVSLFDTSGAISMSQMFKGCSSLTSIPLFDTSLVTSMQDTFSGCTKVESGTLALYQQASSQTNPPPYHSGCFTNCGSGTVTGAAELAQIPNGWK